MNWRPDFPAESWSVHAAGDGSVRLQLPLDLVPGQADLTPAEARALGALLIAAADVASSGGVLVAVPWAGASA